jgi:hypothetical protein
VRPEDDEGFARSALMAFRPPDLHPRLADPISIPPSPNGWLGRCN